MANSCAAENPGVMEGLLDARAVTPAPAATRVDRVRRVLDALALALLALYVWVYAARNLPLQWDLRTYRHAARAAWAGLDPYAPGVLRALAGREVLPFVYPPVTLLPFSALAALPEATAAALWMAAKLVLLLGLVALWKRVFVPGASTLALALVTVLGWNASALSDLGSGNVALLECALLWTAFACFVHGRRTAFAALVIAAACFKLVPAAFLLLLLVPAGRARPEPARFAAAVAALVALVAVPMAIGPAARWEPFWSHLPPAGTLMAANPSGMGLARDVALRASLAGPLAERLAWVAWAAGSAGLVALSAPYLARLWREGDARRWIMAAVFLMVLVSPRPMAYGFVVLAPAALALAPAPFRGRTGALVLAAALSAQGFTRIAQHASDTLAFVYAPWLLTACVWLLVLSGERATAGAARHS